MSSGAELQVAIDRSHSEAVVKLVGEINADSSVDLRRILTRLIDAGHVNLVVDARDLTYIDSTGLGVLVGALKRARTSAGTLRLRHVHGVVEQALSVARLNRVFDEPRTGPGRVHEH